MNSQPHAIGTDRVLFLRRDQITIIALTDTDLALTTTLGSRITVVGPRRELEEFAEDLASNAEGNFVTIPSSLWAMTANQEPTR